MPTSPWTQADIDELRTRIKAFAGVESTSFQDQSTSFDMKGALALLAEMEASVAAAAGAPKNYRLAATSKGV